MEQIKAQLHDIWFLIAILMFALACACVKICELMISNNRDLIDIMNKQRLLLDELEAELDKRP